MHFLTYASKNDWYCLIELICPQGVIGLGLGVLIVTSRIHWHQQCSSWHRHHHHRLPLPLPYCNLPWHKGIRLAESAIQDWRSAGAALTQTDAALLAMLDGQLRVSGGCCGAGRGHEAEEGWLMGGRRCHPPVVVLLLPVIITVRGGGHDATAEGGDSGKLMMLMTTTAMTTVPLPLLGISVLGLCHRRQWEPSGGGNTIRLRIHQRGWCGAFVKPSSPSRRQQSTYQNDCQGYLCGVLCCYGGRVAGGGREKCPESLQKTFRDS